MLNLDADKFLWEDAGRVNLLTTGHQLGKAGLLYAKIEDEVIEKQIAKLKSTLSESVNAQNAVHIAEPLKPEITYDEFSKMDIRVGTILTAEKVAKADKLLKLSIDLGFETRTVVSGISEYFKPEEIIGRQVSVLANLEPRKIRGIESKGMILMAEDETGKLHFVSPQDFTSNSSVIR